MQTWTSVSGGRTSAYVADKYRSDNLLFALVRVEDQDCRFPDEKIRREVEDRIQAPFIGTVEDDMIIYTMLDLEQYLGQKINWVSGITFDQVVKEKGGWLPNKLHRYCTEWMKIIPMCEWWNVNIGEPVTMQIGYRANETDRANRMLAKLNENGLLTCKIQVSTKIKFIIDGFPFYTKRKQNKVVEWQIPSFPLIEDGIFKHDISKHWQGKSVRFADYNNCEGCFHRSDLFLAKRFDASPKKMNWFKKQENGRKRGTWKSDIRYEEIEKFNIQRTLSFEDLGDCESGFCEPN